MKFYYSFVFNCCFSY